MVALVTLSACAGESTARRTDGKATAQPVFCMPCTMPCLNPDSCKPAKVAAAPTPPPAAPAPAPVAEPVEPTAAATFNPLAGEFTSGQSVALSSVTPGAVIHYTTDGSTPTADSPVYSGPIPVEKTTTLHAIAIAPGAPASPVSTAVYTIAPPPPPPAPSRVEVTKERLELKESVLFQAGKAVIDARSNSLLDEVAAALVGHPEVKHVKIEGHTDSRGNAKSNLKLSKVRAEAVRKYLVKHGVEAGRLSAEGFGQTRPIDSNKTEAGRVKNRRVDFIIVQD
jgi:outer membrane protein OmpA-like peptidoglycan-associated protein